MRIGKTYYTDTLWRPNGRGGQTTRGKSFAKVAADADERHKRSMKKRKPAEPQGTADMRQKYGDLDAQYKAIIS